MDLSKQVITDNLQDIYYKIIVYTSKRSMYTMWKRVESLLILIENPRQTISQEKNLFLIVQLVKYSTQRIE